MSEELQESIGNFPARTLIPNPKNFKAPKDFNIYVSQIHDKVNNLIKQNIWRGIEKTKLRQWLKNFNSDEEKYFAVCILDNLIYRNDLQTQSMMFNLMSIDIPNLFLKYKPIGIDSYITLTGFKNNVEPNVRLVCVKAEFDAPTKSSHFIARMLKRKMLILERWIITPDQIQNCMNSGTTCFLFIDDFLGTGNQFSEMAEDINLRKMLATPNTFFAYTPLTAHAQGIKYLNEHFPELKITYVEKLEDFHSIFQLAFNDGVNNPVDSKAFYIDFMKRKSGILNLTEDELLGYGKLELLYAFEQSVPDNNLQLMYWSRNSSINSLFNR